ncbi:chromosome partitioning protein ParA [Vibrio hippocampi]|uniref:Chromosome partitioning protein ParA n=1 Tax=Vibrio hippocampi TaxID=654686 RepID=A0ABN8DIV5_9VIBR|nr:chromosome partitioning protein ParA [Vibrio hippocampi]CAH0526681.1 hypothetical protein VHP8226_02052 [Vibrio hippocampi]
MVSIQGLPSVPTQRKTNKTNKASKNAVAQSSTVQQSNATQVSKVAQAVSTSVQQMSEADIHKARLQYDLPEGRSRKALEEYMSVMNRAKREELEALLGVDLYI